MKNKKNIQHGDISLHIINKPNIELQEVKQKGDFTLREGEKTGHIHRLMGYFKIYKDKEGNTYINSFGAEIDHYDVNAGNKAEHDTLPVEKGWYIQRQERGYDPIKEEINEVQD